MRRPNEAETPKSKIDFGISTVTGEVYQGLVFLNGQLLDLQYSGGKWRRVLLLSPDSSPFDLLVILYGQAESSVQMKLRCNGRRILDKRLQLERTYLIYHNDSIPFTP